VAGTPATLRITTTTLPGATVGVPCTITLAATGGTTPYTWAKTAGTLPTGLSLSTAGVISGTPTSAGTFNFTVRVTDANGSTATQALSMVVTPANTNPQFKITTTTLPGGKVGVLYWNSVLATGGVKPYTFVKTAGTLPTGVALYSGGVLKGTPTTAGTFSFTVRVTDANGSTATKNLSIIIAP